MRQDKLSEMRESQGNRVDWHDCHMRREVVHVVSFVLVCALIVNAARANSHMTRPAREEAMRAVLLTHDQP